MFVMKLIGLYGLDDCHAYYREQGDCFDFVNKIEYCTKYEDANNDRIKRTLQHKDFYTKMYGAADLIVVSVNSENVAA